MAMLCCVSRKAAAAGGEEVVAARSRASLELSRFVEVCRDLGKAQEDESEALRRLDEAVLDVAAVASSFTTFRRLDTLPEEVVDGQSDTQPEVLRPCGICGRKFNPRSLAKHERICERTAAKKRKPFDSARQRIKGTELAEFLPTQQPATQAGPEPARRQHSAPGQHAEERPTGCRRSGHAWKQGRDEFLRALRAARGESPAQASPQPSQPQSHGSQHASQPQHQQHHPHTQQPGAGPANQRPSTLSLVSASGAPTRANEKGQCPTCQRQFGLKSYERHVAFCRERATRLPASPQTASSVAKERLEARMKYRAPGLRNRRPTNREKYSPGAQHKLVQHSPLLARSPMKDAPAPAKPADTPSPKLPVLNKRPGQTNKESPATTNSGPLKSRPMDRSNRQFHPQELPNPPALKQLFASRRLLLLSDVLPAKILQSKFPCSSSSSQKSSASLVPQFLNKPVCEFPAEPSRNSTEAEEKLRKKMKLKKRGHRKVQPDRVEEVKRGKQREEEQGLVTWRQIREDARKNGEMESIDKEEEPVLSDITGLSSLDEGNSTTDEFEFNERMLSVHEASGPPPGRGAGVGGTLADQEQDFEGNELPKVAAFNKTYVIDDTVIRRNEDSFDGIVDRKQNENCDSDDEDGLSSASVRTFKKEDHKSNCIEFVESLDSCLFQRKDKMFESTESKIGNSLTEDTETLKSYNVHADDSESMLPENENSEHSSPSTKIKERLKTRPMKSHSLPNITSVREARTLGACEANVKNTRQEEDDLDRSFAKNCGQTIDARESIPSPRRSEARATRLNCSSRRCATYVIEEASNSSHRQPRHQQPSDDESSENKPMKKLRKLLRQQSETDDDDSRFAAKNEPRQRRHVKNAPETAVPENKARPVRYGALDCRYDGNDATSLSDVSSVRAEEQPELEEDFADETESNASELLREIDSGMRGSSQDSLAELVGRMRANELAAGPRRRLAEETSSRHFEQEICSIQRLEVPAREVSFLPSIDCQRPARRERLEYRRSRRGLEAPREDDEDEGCSRMRLGPAGRRLLQLDRRSLLRRSFERLPRCDWNSYTRRHPDFSMILRGRIGASKDYDPFLLAEQQLNDLFSDTSDQSSTDGSSICPPQKPNSSPNFSLSHTSAFVKYPNGPKAQSPSSSPPAQASADKHQQQPQSQPQQRRLSVIAPPLGFDDLTSSDLSSDCCTETNSVSRELLSSSGASGSLRCHGLEQRELGRRLIIDQSQALGGGEFAPEQFPGKQNGASRGPGPGRPAARSGSLRLAPKPPERKISSSSSSGSSDFTRKPCSTAKQQSCRPAGASGNNTQQQQQQQQRAVNGCKSVAEGSSLSLSSIISDAEIKRSNSLFDELLSSFEEDAAESGSTLPSLMSLVRNETGLSLLPSSAAQQQALGNGLAGHHGQQRGQLNGRINGSDDDAELSSPESVKRQECGKLSADSAYSSLNRKYSNHGRSANDVNGGWKYKLSKFCHECGFKFPDSAKFCCECGVKRLTL